MLTVLPLVPRLHTVEISFLNSYNDPDAEWGIDEPGRIRMLGQWGEEKPTLRRVILFGAIYDMQPETGAWERYRRE